MIRRNGLDYDVEYASCPGRSHRYADAVWCTDAAITIRCTRCERSTHGAVPAAEIQAADPNNNHLLGSRADGLVRLCRTAEAMLASLVDRLCWPAALANGVDLEAPPHEHHEALAVAFATLASQPGLNISC